MTIKCDTEKYRDDKNFNELKQSIFFKLTRDYEKCTNVGNYYTFCILTRV